MMGERDGFELVDQVGDSRRPSRVVHFLSGLHLLDDVVEYVFIHPPG
jgi:hypothetical protein